MDSTETPAPRELGRPSGGGLSFGAAGYLLLVAGAAAILTVPFHVRSAELFAAWCEWCRAEGEEPGTQTAFSTALVNRGFDKRRSSAGYVWDGLGLAGDGGDE